LHFPYSEPAAADQIVPAGGQREDSGANQLAEGIAAYQRGDYASAMRLLRLLADQGMAPAQSGLCAMYTSGKSFPQDYAQAAMWCRKAADQGNADAQASLGWLYANGQGVEQDDTQALMWSTLAATRGEDGATRELALKVRDSLTARMTPAQIAEAQRMARGAFSEVTQSSG
jgi:uncharacterized protein